MSLRVLVDMNLSPDWVAFFAQHQRQAIHWSQVGDPRASDQAIMAWARQNGWLVFTHDLDFGALLALTQAESPSVIQVRAQDVLPDHLGPIVLTALQQHEAVLERGALMVVDESALRVRLLPLRRSE